MADGSIRINCDIDITGAEKDINKLMSDLNKLVNSVNTFKAALSGINVNAFNNIDNNIDNIDNKAKTSSKSINDISTAANKAKDNIGAMSSQDLDKLISDLNKVSTGLNGVSASGSDTGSKIDESRKSIMDIQHDAYNASKAINSTSNAISKSGNVVSASTPKFNKLDTALTAIKVTGKASHTVISNIGTVVKNSASHIGNAVKKMGSFVSNLRSIKSTSSSAIPSINGLSSALKGSATEFLSKVNILKGAITSFISVFKNLNSAYAIQSSAEARLEQTMKNTTNASNEQIQSIKDLTSNYQKLGVLGDEVQLTGLQKIASYVKDASSIEKIAPALNDLTVKQYGYNATAENSAQIATAIGKAYNGSVDALKKYGITLSDVEKETLKYGSEAKKVEVITNAINRSAGGMNEALANTPTGRIKQLSNNFGDLKESLGELLSYTLVPLVSVLNSLIIKLITAAKSATVFAKSLLGIGDLKTNIEGLVGVSDDSTSDSLNDTSDALDNTSKSAKKTKKEIKNLLSPLDELNILSNNISDDLGDASSSLSGEAITPEVGDIDKSALKSIDSKYKDLAKNIKSYFADIFKPVKDAWAKYGTPVIDGWKFALESVKGLLLAIGKS